MLLQETRHGLGLVRRHREIVAESSTTVNNLFAGAFGVVYRVSRVDLGGANRGDIRTVDGERKDELSSVFGRDTCNGGIVRRGKLASMDDNW